MPVQTLLPTAAGTADGTPSSQLGRTDGYGGSVMESVFNRDMWSSAEGSRYVAVNPTPGTGILGHAAPTTFDETKPFLYIYNGGSRTVYLSTVRLTDTVVSVGGTRIQFTQTLDSGNKFSSGGTALVKAATNAASTMTSGATITAGAVLVSAATANRRLLGNKVIKGANIDVVWDQIELVFGTTGGSTGGMLTPTTVAQWYSQPCAAVAISPGWGWGLYQWAASQSTGPTYEVEVDFIER
jgi:hypothetical protein